MIEIDGTTYAEPELRRIIAYAREMWRFEIEGLCDDCSGLAYNDESKLQLEILDFYAIGAALSLPFEEIVRECGSEFEVKRLAEAVRRVRPDAFPGV